MKCLVAVFGLLVGLQGSWADEWELAYPDAYPVADEMPYLSIGHNGAVYMIGSRSGYILTDIWDRSPMVPPLPPFTQSYGTLYKLPVPFDITAISAADLHWILGGPRGQFAIHSNSEYVPFIPSTQDAILDGWELGRIDTSRTIVKLAATEDRILALLSSGEILFSADKGESWSPVNILDGIYYDIQEFNGAFFVLSRRQIEDSGYLALVRSEDLETWTPVWEVSVGTGGSPVDAQMMALGDFSLGWRTYDDESFPFGNRLYVRAEFGEYDIATAGQHLLSVSSPDGETWMDNGSVRKPGGPSISYYVTPWNPLSLPRGRLFGHRPTWPSGRKISGNYCIDSNQVKVYRGHEWIEGISTTGEGRIGEETIDPDTICLWSDLSFNLGDSGIISITEDGLEMHPAPDFKVAFYGLQMVCAGGRYFAVGGLSEQETSPSKLATSDDMENWQTLPLPEGAISIRLIQAGNTVAAFYRYYTQSNEWKKALSIYDNGWSYPIILSDEVLDVAWVPEAGAFFTLQTLNATDSSADPESKVVRIEKVNTEGNIELFSSFLPEVWNGYFKRLDCPDGESLVVYGDSAEITRIRPDGTIQNSHPWQLFPPSEYHIDSVKFVNGWFYLLGPAAIRTKDFVDYETVPLPFDQALNDVVGFGDKLYGFVDGAVYTLPLETGYLDSVIRNQGWRHSDWFGWFKLIDEAAGQVYHLSLGSTTVMKINDNAYSLDTATLGILFARKDWMPWVQRESDGHWFWIDPASWPPRAWDADTEMWVELSP